MSKLHEVVITVDAYFPYSGREPTFVYPPEVPNERLPEAFSGKTHHPDATATAKYSDFLGCQSIPLRRREGR
jgi:hypothetical protein